MEEKMTSGSWERILPRKEGCWLLMIESGGGVSLVLGAVVLRGYRGGCVGRLRLPVADAVAVAVGR